MYSKCHESDWVIMVVLILFGVIDIGGKPCEHNTIEEAFNACMDSISNRY